MRVALYARVSTVDKGQDVGLQLRDLRQYVKARRWVLHREYIDEISSGKARPALQVMEDACRKRQVDVVLVWRLDRLGRSLKHLVLFLDELRSLGIDFVSYRENIDFTTSSGKLMFQLLAAFAEFEREVIRERVRAGLANARAKGKVLGRPRKVIDHAQLVARRKGGASFRRIAKETGIPTTSVRRALHA